MLGGCAPDAPPDVSEGIAVRWAGQSSGACTVPARGLPGRISSVVVQRRDADGWAELATLSLAEADPDGTLLEGVPAGETTVRLVACDADRPVAVARPLPFALGQDDKLTTVALFRPLNALSCAGTGLGPAHDQYARMTTAFGTGLRLPRIAGEAFVAGGADQIGEAQLNTTDALSWSVFDWHEGLFWPGVAREIPLDPRRLPEARQGAAMGAFTLDGVEGALLVGGTPSIVLGADTTLGPLRPAPPADDAAFGLFFDPENGGLRPYVLNPPPTAHSLAGVGAGNGWLVRAGGLAHGPNGELRASTAIEVLKDRTAYTLELPTALIGPSVTHLGGDAFLVWGADVPGCGANPGAIVRAGTRSVTLLTVPDPPACDDFERDWWATGYHSATALPGARVLIVGGLPVKGQRMQSNPDPGLGSSANAFVIAVDGDSAMIHPVELPNEAVDQATRRAFQRAADQGDGRVLLSGGWGSFGKPTTFVASVQTIQYVDAMPAGRLTTGPVLTEARFGHVSVGLSDGRVLIAGGLAPESVEFTDGVADQVGPLRVLDSAEIYTPGLAVNPCVPSVEPAPSPQ